MQFRAIHLLPMRRSMTVFAGLLALLITAGCGGSPSNWTKQETAPSVADVAARTAAGASAPRVLLFVGTGTSSGSVSAWKTILGDLNLKYATATSSQLNGMSPSSLAAYKLLLVPGGNAVTISKSLSSATVTKVHNAINNGLHYLGICAGAFFAGHSGIYNYLDFPPTGVWFNFYADYFRGIHKEAIEIKSANGTRLDQYWQDGPQLSGWGQVVGKYPDGTPAIVQGKSGNGWIIICAVHPEATQSWRGSMKFTTSVAVDNAYAKTLVTNALNGTSLPHF
jgi:glutamine amidotransferase PdxT